MTFWAVLPYAVSLATSVAYQSLRSSSIPYKRKQAYTAFYSSCDILDELSKCFLSARTMGRLAKDTLQEVERVSVNRSRNKPQQREREDPTSIDSRPPPDRPAQLLPDMASGDISSRGVTYPGVSGESSAAAAESTEPDNLQPNIEPSAVAFDFNGMDFSDVGGIFDDFDPSLHLNRIDAVFSANLNPAMPLIPEHWWMEDGQNGYS